MVGMIMAAASYALLAWGTIGAVGQFAVTLLASSIISKAFTPSIDNASLNSLNPGNPQQMPPASDNKLPVIYGTGWTGGILSDMSITSNNQVIYYVLALSECTGGTTATIVSGRSYIVSLLGSSTLAQWQALFSGLSAIPTVNQTVIATSSGTLAGGGLLNEDIFSFGDIFFGGKKCIFDSTNQYLVTGLLDQSTGLNDTTVNGYLSIYLYRNGSYTPYNSSSSAISVMQDSSLVYQWDGAKLMNDCAFAIIKITYNQNANLTGLQPTKFQLVNSRNSPEALQSYRLGSEQSLPKGR